MTIWFRVNWRVLGICGESDQNEHTRLCIPTLIMSKPLSPPSRMKLWPFMELQQFWLRTVHIWISFTWLLTSTTEKQTHQNGYRNHSNSHSYSSTGSTTDQLLAVTLVSWWWECGPTKHSDKFYEFTQQTRSKNTIHLLHWQLFIQRPKSTTPASNHSKIYETQLDRHWCN